MFVRFGVYTLNINKIQCIWISSEKKIMCVYGSERPYENLVIFEDKDGTYDTLTARLQKITEKINKTFHGVTEEKSTQCNTNTVPMIPPPVGAATLAPIGPENGKPLQGFGAAVDLNPKTTEKVDLSPANLELTVAKWDAMIAQKTEEKK